MKQRHCVHAVHGCIGRACHRSTQYKAEKRQHGPTHFFVKKISTEYETVSPGNIDAPRSLSTTIYLFCRVIMPYGRNEGEL
jgi:hypothetical protein